VFVSSTGVPHGELADAIHQRLQFRHDLRQFRELFSGSVVVRNLCEICTEQLDAPFGSVDESASFLRAFAPFFAHAPIVMDCGGAIPAYSLGRSQQFHARRDKAVVSTAASSLFDMKIELRDEIVVPRAQD
jgi:hypothetical protein